MGNIPANYANQTGTSGGPSGVATGYYVGNVTNICRYTANRDGTVEKFDKNGALWCYVEIQPQAGFKTYRQYFGDPFTADGEFHETFALRLQDLDQEAQGKRVMNYVKKMRTIFDSTSVAASKQMQDYVRENGFDLDWLVPGDKHPEGAQIGVAVLGIVSGGVPKGMSKTQEGKKGFSNLLGEITGRYWDTFLAVEKAQALINAGSVPTDNRSPLAQNTTAQSTGYTNGSAGRATAPVAPSAAPAPPTPPI